MPLPGSFIKKKVEKGTGARNPWKEHFGCRASSSPSGTEDPLSPGSVSTAQDRGLFPSQVPDVQGARLTFTDWVREPGSGPAGRKSYKYTLRDVCFLAKTHRRAKGRVFIARRVRQWVMLREPRDPSPRGRASPRAPRCLSEQGRCPLRRVSCTACGVVCVTGLPRAQRDVSVCSPAAD